MVKICKYMLFWTFLLQLFENIDISPENFSINDQNVKPFNPSNKETDCFTELIIIGHLNRSLNLIIRHLNINQLRNQFESVKLIISPNFDIFLVSETKLDESFPNNQFCINGYRIVCIVCPVWPNGWVSI